MVKTTYQTKVKEVVARAVNLSDAFEETCEELYNLLDSFAESARVHYGFDSQRYKECAERRKLVREVIKKAQQSHLEGFDLLLDFIKKHDLKKE